jgi:hypothetical protein
MCTVLRRSSALPVAALGLLLVSACGGHNTSVDVPVAVGFSPLEPISQEAVPPPAAGNVLHPEGLGPVIQVPGSGHYASHARGYVNAPVAKVYQALKDPASGYLNNQDGAPRFDRPPDFNVEPEFPISFVVHYKTVTPVGISSVTTKYDVTVRGGVSSGTELAPLEVGRRYDKTWGTSYIQVMSGSLRARPVPGDEGVTEVELESWLKAETQGQADCDLTVVTQFNKLVAFVATLP